MQIIQLTPADSIQEAAKKLNKGDKLFLKKGIYRQTVDITTPDILIEGEDKNKTIIVGDNYAKKIASDGLEYNTFRTHTMLVFASGVSIKELTIENCAGAPAQKGQAVALAINGGEFFAEDCVFKSMQDTLFCAPLPDDLVVRYEGFLSDSERLFVGKNIQVFNNCDIYGSVDFIFGCGNAHFNDCRIISIDDGRKIGFVAAPAHCKNNDDGFCFVRCSFINGGVSEQSVFLARPWRDYGRATFLDCQLDLHIKRELFDKWEATERDKTARFFQYPKNPDCVSFAKTLTKKEQKLLIDRYKLEKTMGSNKIK